MSIYWREAKVDSILDGDAKGNGDGVVENATGTYSEVIALSGTVGVLLIVDMLFVDPATDNGVIEVYESDDGVTYTKNATYDAAVTKDAGETVTTIINVTTATQFIKVLAKSAGATDTITVTLTRQKKSNERGG